MKKLIVVECTVTEEDFNSPERRLPVGDVYTFFQDPETQKRYRPIAGFTVLGDDLTDMFVEVQ